MSELPFHDVHIETTLPKAWEQEETFNDVLYDWMSRAPWLLLSAAMHFVLFLVVAAIPWQVFETSQEKILQADVTPPPEEVFEDPPPEVEPELEEIETEEVPIVEDYEVSDHNENDTDDIAESMEGDPDQSADSPFDAKASNDMIGIGGPAGGKYGHRIGGRRKLRAGGPGFEVALEDGLRWLRDHQDEDGRWDSAGFMKHDPANDKCTGPGDAAHDVGVTGLALLAFLGDGHTMRSGNYKDVVTNGIKWLRQQQDDDSGLIGEGISHAFIYDHAIATLAMCEAYYFDKTPFLRTSAQSAVRYITMARNPYGVWRYQVPPVGDNDTSITGWMVFALKSAEEAKLTIDRDAFQAAESWFDAMTDEATGRCGYTEMGGLSSRLEGSNEDYPREGSEAMTAVALLSRIFMSSASEPTAIMKKHADLLLKSPPKWEPNAKANDMYYWYYGSYAMYQMGGKYWETWNKAMKGAVLGSQRKDGAHEGSWDPVGPWGFSGGRVYSTALMVLCLEVYFRYGQVLGAR